MYWQHPSFFAYFPTASTFEAMLGDLLSSSTSNPGFNVHLEVWPKLIQCLTAQWAASPASTELEVVVMDWAVKMFGLHSVSWNASEVGGGVIMIQVRSYLLVRAYKLNRPPADCSV